VHAYSYRILNVFFETDAIQFKQDLIFLGMKEVFDKYDTKSQGIIKTSLFGKILRTLGLNPLESDIQRVTKEVDPQSKKNFI
jgi:Ca2+-binding EF-hand superfamily protein